MEACGPYKIVRELASGAGSVSFLARDETSEAILTVFNSSGGEASEVIELQKRVAGGSRHVAPVNRSGASEEGEWYATRTYPRTVAGLLEGRVALGRAWILEILLAMTRGALAFKKEGGRGHGNLQPQNVLLGASTNIKEAEVVINAPAAEQGIDSGEFERRDLKAIGMALCQLVRRREMDERSIILPLEGGPEWKAAFGKDAADWLELCNRLLSADLPPGYGLEQLETELVSLQPRPAVSRKQLVAVAAVLLLAGVGAVIAMWLKGQAKLEVASNLPGATVSIVPSVVKPFTVTEPATVKVKRGASYTLTGKVGEFEASTNVVIVQRREKVALQFSFATLRIEARLPQADGTTNTVVFTNLLVKPGVEVSQSVVIEGYNSASVTTNVGAGETRTATVNLERHRPGSVFVEVTSLPIRPPAELLYVGGPENVRETDMTRSMKSLLPGTYEVRARYRGIEQRKEIVVRVGEPMTGSNRVEFVFPTAPLTFLATNAIDGSRVTAAKVLWQGAEVGAAGAEMLWPIGTWTFHIEAEGYDRATGAVTLAKQDAGVTAALGLNPVLGIVSVTSDPPTGVSFATNPNQRVWWTAPTKVMLPPTNYILYGRHEELGATNVSIAVKRGESSVSIPFAYGRVKFTANLDGVLIALANSTNMRTLSSVSMLPVGPLPAKAVYPPAALSITTNLDIPVARDKPTPFEFSFAYATLMLTSAPAGASVYRDKELKESLMDAKEPIKQIVGLGKYTYYFVGISEGKRQIKSASVEASTPGTYWVGADFNKPAPHILKLADRAEMEFLWIAGADFYVSKHEVTQLQYQLVMGTNPSKLKLGPAYPVDQVTWADASGFCRRLNEIDRNRPPGYGYSLPRLKQWDVFVGNALTDASLAVIRKGGVRLANALPVGSLQPNDHGLYDVRGNVAEWTLDDLPVGSHYDSPFLGQGAQRRIVGTPREAADTTIGFRVILAPGTQETASK